MAGLYLVALAAAAISAPSSSEPAGKPGPQVPPFTSLASTMKLEHDDGAEHMCPGGAQLTSFQANSGIDNAPVGVELLGPDGKPLPDKAWSIVAGLRVLPIVQGPMRITMICSAR